MNDCFRLISFVTEIMEGSPAGVTWFNRSRLTAGLWDEPRNPRAPRFRPGPFSISLVNSFRGSFVWGPLPLVIHPGAGYSGSALGSGFTFPIFRRSDRRTVDPGSRTGCLEHRRFR